MKSIHVPYIPGLESLTFEELDRTMELQAAKDFINEVNWKEYPYKPSVALRVARSETSLVLIYDVRGLDLRADTLENNGPVWEDSCCEFFIANPADNTYHTFEINCIGTLLASRRRSRVDADMFTSKELSRIVCHHTLERKQYYENGSTHSWTLAVCIPFDLLGMDADALPARARANFYKCADKTGHPHYLSWNRIEIPLPDFHRPDYFGELIFQA